MSELGWIKLHRELQNKALWSCSTPVQRSIFITILLNVNHEEKEWEWKGEKFMCKPGQMITSLSSLAQKSGDGVSVQNVRTALTKFEKFGFLTNDSTKTGRLITVVNWGIYQKDDDRPTKELTNSQQSTNKELTTNKNDKNDKNDNKNNNTICSEPKAPNPQAVISLILNNKSYYDIYQCDIDEWRELYPAVNILQELRKMKGWLDANPTKRKTSRGIRRFVNSWLSREQDKGGNKMIDKLKEETREEKEARLQRQWEEEHKNQPKITGVVDGPFK